MTEYANAVHKPMRSLAISMADVKTLYDSLNEKITEVLAKEITPIDGISALTEEQKTNYKKDLVQAYRIAVVFGTTHGGQIILSNSNPFGSPQLEGQSIETVQIKCAPALGGTWLPLLAFDVFFDFSKPNLFNWNAGVSDPTSNNSYFNIYGTDDTFISATRQKVENFLDRKSTKRNWLHASNIYDIGLWLIAMPISFFVSLRLNHTFKNVFNDTPSILENLAYVYVFFIVVILYRIVVGYTKWLWPKVEKTDYSPSKTHRGFWSAILIGIIIFYITEIARYLLTPSL